MSKAPDYLRDLEEVIRVARHNEVCGARHKGRPAFQKKKSPYKKIYEILVDDRVVSKLKTIQDIFDGKIVNYKLKEMIRREAIKLAEQKENDIMNTNLYKEDGETADEEQLEAFIRKLLVSYEFYYLDEVLTFLPFPAEDSLKLIEANSKLKAYIEFVCDRNQTVDKLKLRERWKEGLAVQQKDVYKLAAREEELRRLGNYQHSEGSNNINLSTKVYTVQHPDSMSSPRLANSEEEIED